MRISEQGRGNGLSPLGRLTAPTSTLLTALWKPAPGHVFRSLSSASHRSREGPDQLHLSSTTPHFSSLWPKTLDISGDAAFCPQVSPQKSGLYKCKLLPCPPGPASLVNHL